LAALQLLANPLQLLQLLDCSCSSLQLEEVWGRVQVFSGCLQLQRQLPLLLLAALQLLANQLQLHSAQRLLAD
jgi:hypothetical protein